FLIRVLERPDFRQLSGVHTGWLDQLIAKKMKKLQTRKQIFVNVLCGVLYRAYTQFETLVQEYIDNIRKGQIFASPALHTSAQVELILNNVRYAFHVQRCGIESFFIEIDSPPPPSSSEEDPTPPSKEEDQEEEKEEDEDGGKEKGAEERETNEVTMVEAEV